MPKRKTKRNGQPSRGRGFSFRTTLGYVAGPYQVTNGVIAGIWSMGFSSIALQSIAFAQMGDAYRFFKIHHVHIEVVPSYLTTAGDMSPIGVHGAIGWVPEGSTAPNDLTDFETTAMSRLTHVGGVPAAGGSPKAMKLDLGAEHFLGQTGGWFVTHSDATDPFLDTVGQVYLVLSDVVTDTQYFLVHAIMDVEFKEPLDPASISLAAERRLLRLPDFQEHLRALLEKASTEEKGKLLRELLPSFK